MQVGLLERYLVCNGPPVFSVACFVFVTYLRGEGWLLTCSLCDYTCCFGGFVDLPPPLARGGRPATLPPGGGSHICSIRCKFRQGAGRALHPWAVSANFVHCRVILAFTPVCLAVIFVNVLVVIRHVLVMICSSWLFCSLRWEVTWLVLRVWGARARVRVIWRGGLMCAWFGCLGGLQPRSGPIPLGGDRLSDRGGISRLDCQRGWIVRGRRGFAMQRRGEQPGS